LLVLPAAELLRRTEENRERRVKERLNDYYKRNFKVRQVDIATCSSPDRWVHACMAGLAQAMASAMQHKRRRAHACMHAWKQRS
jgi:hypothetical protein